LKPILVNRDWSFIFQSSQASVGLLRWPWTIEFTPYFLSNKKHS
jgi:hypothetical protein